MIIASRQRIVVLSVASVCLVAYIGQAKTLSVDEVISHFESGETLRVFAARRAISNQEWTNKEAARLATALAKQIDSSTNVNFSAIAIKVLASRYPAECRPAVMAMINAISVQSNRGGAGESETCDVAIALGSLEDYRAESREALRGLMLLDDQRPYASIWAASALGRLYPDDATPVNWLLARIESPRRDAAIAGLGEIGSASKEAIPTIGKLLNDSSSATRTVAAVALIKIDPVNSDDAIEVLCKALEEEPDAIIFRPYGPSPPALEHTSYAASALAKMGKYAENVVPKLMDVRSRGTERQRKLVDLALEGIRRSAGSVSSEEKQD